MIADSLMKSIQHFSRKKNLTDNEILAILTRIVDSNTIDDLNSALMDYLVDQLLEDNWQEEQIKDFIDIVIEIR